MKTVRQRVIPASPEAVWRAISPLERAPQWLAGVESVEHTGGPVEGVGRQQRLTKLLYKHDVEIDQEIAVWESQRQLSLKHVRESSGGKDLNGVRDFHTTVFLEPERRGTRVRVEYTWKASLGLAWLFSFLLGGRVMSGELKETLTKIELLVRAK